MSLLVLIGSTPEGFALKLPSVPKVSNHILIVTVPLLFSLGIAIYLLTIKGRNRIVFDFFIGADQNARPVLTNELKAREEMLNGCLFRCAELENDNVEKSRHLWISGVAFVIGLIMLLISIAESIELQGIILH